MRPRCGPSWIWDIVGIGILLVLVEVCLRVNVAFELALRRIRGVRLLARLSNYIGSLTQRSEGQDEDEKRELSRAISLDQLRGCALGMISVFHVSRDFRTNRLIQVPSFDSITSPGDHLNFIGYTVFCVIVWFIIVPTSERLAGVWYIIVTWRAVTAWKNVSVYWGMRLIVFCLGAGATLSLSRHRAQILAAQNGVTPAREKSYLLRLPSALPSFGRVLKLGGTASLITVITRLLSAHRWIGCGALHMLFMVTLIQVPFIEAPIWFALASAASLLALDFGGLLPQPERAIGRPWSTWDYHPILCHVPYALFGIVLFRIGFQRVRTVPSPLIWPRKMLVAIAPSIFGKCPVPAAYELRPDALLTIYGRNSLALYLVQRPLLWPIVFLAATCCEAWY